MQTDFSLAQLADPDIAEANGILRNCVHCGFCTATCPTYTLLGDELDSPRGRIYLIKGMLEADAPATEEVVTHIDRCLSCLSCMTTCPSGVHYMHLVDHARRHIEDTYNRSFIDRTMRWFLATFLPVTSLFRLVMTLGWLARPFRKLVPPPFRAALSLAPASLPKRSVMDRPGVFPADGERRGRVALLAGCVQPALDPAINDATIRLLNRRGIDVVIPPDAGCCGSLTHHLGKEAPALAAARANIDAWCAEADTDNGGQGLDAILVNASGCGTTVKDYGFMLRTDEAYAAKAERVADLTRDITEYLEEIGLGEAREAPALTVAYHSACSMQHGQKLTQPPKRLLVEAGFAVRDPAEGHLCCGSAGTYNILQAPIADRLKERKVGNLDRLDADVIATGNIGCITQLNGAAAAPVVHTVELLDWATGGPRPARLKGVGADRTGEDRPS